MNLPEIRQGLCDAVKANTTIVRTHPYIPNRANPPGFVVGEVELTYHGAMGIKSLSTARFTCWLFTSNANDRTGQEELDLWLTDDEGGIAYALEVDQKLGGVAHGVVARNAISASPNIAGTDYYGAQFTVEVYA